MTRAHYPEKWWQDAELLREIVELHGGQSEASAYCGGKPSQQTLSAWWTRHGLPRLGSGRHTHAPDADAPITEVEQLRAELRHLRAQASQDRTGEAALNHYSNVLAETVAAVTPTMRPPRSRPNKRIASEHAFVLLWSDLHAAEVVSAEETNGLNAYDWDEMLRRHERLTESIVSFRDNRPYPVGGLHVLALGDMVTGDIHDELRVTNEKVATEAAVQLGADMGEWARGLSAEFPSVRFSCVFGNHGRLTQRPSFKQAFNNWDWLFYRVLEERLSAHEAISFDVSRAAQLPVEILGRRFLLWHGDGVRTTMPGVPWGGIIRRCNELERTYATIGKPIDHFAVGHWHEANIVRAGKIAMNGSVKGADEYSIARFGTASPPQQLLLTLHPEHGLTDTSFLDLAP